MKRHLLILAIVLLAGAVVNVVVAWGCALWSPSMPSVIHSIEPLEPDQSHRQWWATHRPHQFPDAPEVVVSWRWFTPGVSAVSMARDVPDGVRGWDASRLRAGLPARSFEGRIWSCDDGTDKREGWVEVPVGYGVIPLYSIWPGFAVNTCFYAALLWSPFVLRRRIRVRRRLCPKCAYPKGESEVCSECGEALPHSRRHIIA